jgi:polyisoprenoid-binding protein YceI
MKTRHAVFPAAVAHAIWLAPSVADAQSATFAPLNAPTGLPVQRFDIDWPHSAVGFSVGFMGLSAVTGAFASFGASDRTNTVAYEYLRYVH